MAKQDKEQQKKLLIEMMNEDAKDGLYEPVTNSHTLTAVEWLFNMLWKTPQYETEWQELYKQAKQMEKEQIMKTARQCHFEGVRQSAKTSEGYIMYAEQYYNETYKKTYGHN